MAKFETDAWPYVPAKFIGPRRTGRVRGIVIHTAEIPEHSESAERLAQYGRNPDKESSWHVSIDSNSVVQSVRDSFVAYAAPGTNHDMIQLELCCYMGQTASQWRDFYSLALIANAADVVAQYALKYDIPIRQLTDAQLFDEREAGIIGHVQATRVFKRSDHTDPGPNFPWPRLIGLANLMANERRGLVV